MLCKAKLISHWSSGSNESWIISRSLIISRSFNFQYFEARVIKMITSWKKKQTKKNAAAKKSGPVSTDWSAPQAAPKTLLQAHSGEKPQFYVSDMRQEPARKQDPSTLVRHASCPPEQRRVWATHTHTHMEWRPNTRQPSFGLQPSYKLEKQTKQKKQPDSSRFAEEATLKKHWSTW